jgi:hypothetical protein
MSGFWDWFGRWGCRISFPSAAGHALRNSAPSGTGLVMHIVRWRWGLGRWWGRWWSTRSRRWLPVITISREAGKPGQKDKPVRIKLSTRTVLGLHHHEVSKLAARWVSIELRCYWVATYCCMLRRSSRSLPTSPKSIRTSVASALLNSSRYCRADVSYSINKMREWIIPLARYKELVRSRWHAQH